MTPRSFGTLRHDAEGKRPSWKIKAEPHVMVRLKRLFPRVSVHRLGEIVVVDTPETARDVEWVLGRWPLDTDEETARLLRRRADEHRATESEVERILAGGQGTFVDMAEPARPPRHYQTVAADLALTTGRLLLLDELGLGKSMSGLMLLRAPDSLPAVVVTLTHLPRQWLDELAKTWPMLRGHIVKKGSPYDLRDANGGEPDVVILNYAKLDGWAEHLAAVVRTVIFDEMQELRRDGTRKYQAGWRIASAARYKVGLTATPVYNYGSEMFNIIQVLDPGTLGSREEFSREWGMGERSVRDPGALGSYLREQGLMLRRTRKEVGRELPEVVRVVQPISCDEEELKRLSGDAVALARLILSDQTASRDRFVLSGDLDWKLRQATGIAKAAYVAEFVKMLLATEEQVVLFGWHRAVYDIWEEALLEYRPAFYTGEESPTQKADSAKRFLEGDARVLIMSLRAGAGLDGLQEASHVAVFGELDWSPGVHDQCTGRLHRDGQDEPVIAYFLVADDGSDPIVSDVLGLKRMQSGPLIDPDAALFEPAVDATAKVRLLAEEVLRRAKS